SPGAPFTSGGTDPPGARLDRGLCTNGLYCLLLMQDRKICNDVDEKNLGVKLTFLMTKMCIK
ncbi:hypothetical protein N325_11030, partial [Colius striatus]